MPLQYPQQEHGHKICSTNDYQEICMTDDGTNSLSAVVIVSDTTLVVDTTITSAHESPNSQQMPEVS
jgi:hypothetical protein